MKTHNVGIGTTTPVSLLNLNGPVGASSGLSFRNGNISLFEAADDNFRINVRGSRTLDLTRDSGGDVFLGIRNQDTGGDAMIHFSHQAGNMYGFVGRDRTTDDIQVGGFTGHELTLFANNTEAVRVDLSGNVGIGTTTPEGALEVSVGSVGDTKLYISSDPDNNDENDNSYLIFKQDGSRDRAMLWTADYAGINVLNISSSAAGTAGSGSIYFRTDNVNNGAETAPIRMTLDHNGNLGIGSTAPSVALDVVGDIQYTGTITDVSDRRRKENIKPIAHALETITAVDGVSFIMKGDEKRRIEFGVIAQDLEEVLPELVHTAADEQMTKSVNYVGFIGWIIEAIKDLVSSDDKLQSQIDEKDKRISDLENEVQNLKALIEEKLK